MTSEERLPIHEETLKAQDSRLAAARVGLEAARSRLSKARTSLEQVEEKVRGLWRAKRAALDSLKSTIAAQRNCGSEGTALSKLSISRIRGRAESAASEIRQNIASAEAICREFYGAWD